MSLLLNHAHNEGERGEAAPSNIEKTCPVASQNTRLEVARRIYDMRRSREQFLPVEMFSEPAWDILLFLYIARAEQHRATVGAACASAGVPVSTALRWIQRLVTVGMVEKEAHPTNQRVHWLTLAPNTQCQLDRFLDRLKGKHWNQF